MLCWTTMVRSNWFAHPSSFLLIAIASFPIGCGGTEFSGTTSTDSGSGGGAGDSVGAGGAGGAQDGGASTDGRGEGAAGTGGQHGGAGGMSGAGGTMIICPPCVAPPDPACKGQGPCGCGPYVCPLDGSIDARDGGIDAGDGGPLCGSVHCPLGKVCCNALMGICTDPGVICTQ
jgi:hypothetical protein